MIAFIKKIAFYLGYPFYGYLDRRFSDVLSELRKLQNDVDTALSADAHLVIESLNYMERAGPSATADVDESKEKTRVFTSSALPPLNKPIARFMNTIEGHQSYAAQAGLWFNPPTRYEYQPNSVKIRELNERIIEMPFAYAAAGTLPPGSRVLDIGSTESLVSISLANLGFNVTSLDLRPYPIKHPRIHNVVGDATTWPGPEKPFDAIFCISTIEHFGIAAYGYAEPKPDLDLQAIDLFKKWLKPGGLLILTIPYGQFAVTELQRIYDAKRVERLLQGWKIISRSAYAHAEPTRWEKVDDESLHKTWPKENHGVLMIKAERP